MQELQDIYVRYKRHVQLLVSPAATTRDKPCKAGYAAETEGGGGRGAGASAACRGIADKGGGKNAKKKSDPYLMFEDAGLERRRLSGTAGDQRARDLQVC